MTAYPDQIDESTEALGQANFGAFHIVPSDRSLDRWQAKQFRYIEIFDIEPKAFQSLSFENRFGGVTPVELEPALSVLIIQAGAEAHDPIEHTSGDLPKN